MPSKPRLAKELILAPPVEDRPEPVGPGRDDPFTFTGEKSGPFTVASLAKINPSETEPFRYIDAMAEDNEQVRTAKLVRLMAEVAAGDQWPAVRAALMKLSGPEFQRFNEEWAAHSGIGAGE